MKLTITALVCLLALAGCATAPSLERPDGQPFNLYPVPENMVAPD